MADIGLRRADLLARQIFRLDVRCQDDVVHAVGRVHEGHVDHVGAAVDGQRNVIRGAAVDIDLPCRQCRVPAERIFENGDVHVVVRNEVLFLSDLQHRIARPGHADTDVDGLFRLGGRNCGRARNRQRPKE